MQHAVALINHLHSPVIEELNTLSEQHRFLSFTGVIPVSMFMSFNEHVDMDLSPGNDMGA